MTALSLLLTVAHPTAPEPEQREAFTHNTGGTRYTISLYLSRSGEMYRIMAAKIKSTQRRGRKQIKTDRNSSNKRKKKMII